MDSGRRLDLLAVVESVAFQQMYGGTSGMQFFGLAAGVALVPILLGWWAYRRSQGTSRVERS